jgi:hypothetical protein
MFPNWKREIKYNFNKTYSFSREMNTFPNGLRIIIGIILIMVFAEWTQSGGNVTATNVPYQKRTFSEKMRSLRTGEAFTNCTCTKDSPIDTKRELCGWEILERTDPSNPCQKHTVYRCMDPDPWKAIDHIPCAHFGKRNSDDIHQKCGLDLEPGHTYMRLCIVWESHYINESFEELLGTETKKFALTFKQLDEFDSEINFSNTIAIPLSIQ